MKRLPLFASPSRLAGALLGAFLLLVAVPVAARADRDDHGKHHRHHDRWERRGDYGRVYYREPVRYGYWVPARPPCREDVHVVRRVVVHEDYYDDYDDYDDALVQVQVRPHIVIPIIFGR